jgi:hypothetical protein
MSDGRELDCHNLCYCLIAAATQDQCGGRLPYMWLAGWLHCQPVRDVLKTSSMLF